MKKIIKKEKKEMENFKNAEVKSVEIMEGSHIFSVCALDVNGKPRYKKELEAIAKKVKDLRNRIDKL
ncbi:MAG TPA: hypothetical protein ENL06_01980 [Candidatus Portnoybacteria bacterium]|nr:hypothetical protein [Candidatus Portnoybacteria bacterium]